MIAFLTICVIVIIGQDPPKKKRKKDTIDHALFVDTVIVNSARRLPLDTIAMEQRIILKELKEQIEIQKQLK
jgi:hypothetical protein